MVRFWKTGMGRADGDDDDDDDDDDNVDDVDDDKGLGFGGQG